MSDDIIMNPSSDDITSALTQQRNLYETIFKKLSDIDNRLTKMEEKANKNESQFIQFRNEQERKNDELAKNQEENRRLHNELKDKLDKESNASSAQKAEYETLKKMFYDQESKQNISEESIHALTKRSNELTNVLTNLVDQSRNASMEFKEIEAGHEKICHLVNDLFTVTDSRLTEFQNYRA